MQIKEFSTKEKDDVASVGSNTLDVSVVKSEPGSNLETVSESKKADSSKEDSKEKEVSQLLHPNWTSNF